MKRWTVQWLILCLVIPLFSSTSGVSTAEAATSANKLTNSGFEQVSGGKPVGWLHSAGQFGTDFGTSDVEAHSRVQSVFVDNTAGEGAYYWRSEAPLEVTDTAEYELAVWVKVADPAMTGQLTLNVTTWIRIRRGSAGQM